MKECTHSFYTAFYEKCGYSKKENEMVSVAVGVLVVVNLTLTVSGQVRPRALTFAQTVNPVLFAPCHMDFLHITLFHFPLAHGTYLLRHNLGHWRMTLYYLPVLCRYPKGILVFNRGVAKGRTCVQTCVRRNCIMEERAIHKRANTSKQVRLSATLATLHLLLRDLWCGADRRTGGGLK